MLRSGGRKVSWRCGCEGAEWEPLTGDDSAEPALACLVEAALIVSLAMAGACPLMAQFVDENFSNLRHDSQSVACKFACSLFGTLVVCIDAVVHTDVGLEKQVVEDLAAIGYEGWGEQDESTGGRKGLPRARVGTRLRTTGVGVPVSFSAPAAEFRCGAFPIVKKPGFS